jgi:hypothetical protein
MYSLLKNIHSYWAYLVLLILILGIFNAIAGKIKGKDFESKDLRLSLFGLIFSHIQLLIGLILYFFSPWFGLWYDLRVGGVIQDDKARLYLVEHPFTNILAIFLISMGWSLHKRQSDPGKKFLRISLFYGLGLLLLLIRFPWDSWIG